jgi:hypothetical protein
VAENKQSIVIFRPTHVLVDWLNRMADSHGQLTLELLRDDSSGYLVPEFSDDEDALPYIQNHATQFFAHLLYGWCTNEALWPEKMDFEGLCQWFDLEFVPTLFDARDWPASNRP